MHLAAKIFLDMSISKMKLRHDITSFRQWLIVLDVLGYS